MSHSWSLQDDLFEDDAQDMEDVAAELDPVDAADERFEEGMCQKPEEVLGTLEKRQEMVLQLAEVMPSELNVADIKCTLGNFDDEQNTSASLPAVCCSQRSQARIPDVGFFDTLRSVVNDNHLFAKDMTVGKTGPNSCLKRMEILFPHLKQFVSEVRVAEGILPGPNFFANREITYSIIL